MSIFLERIDAAPLSNSDFPYEFNQWVANLVDSLNEVIASVQNSFNLLPAPQYTAAEITSLLSGGELFNGILLYDTTNHVYVGMQNGSLVKFTTTSYP